MKPDTSSNADYARERPKSESERAALPLAVIVSRQRITGPNNGSSAYLLALSESLAASGWRVALIQPSPTLAGRTPLLRLSPEMRSLDIHRMRGAVGTASLAVYLRPGIWMAAATGIVRRLARNAGLSGKWTVDRPAPYAVATRWTAADHAFLERHIPAEARLVIADYVFCTEAFRHAPPGARTAILMHDLFHARAADDVDSVARLDRATETEMLGRADAVFAIQASERDFVVGNVPDTQAVLVPMPAKPVNAAEPGEDHRLLFVGSMTSPNVVGLRWFLDEVWPRLRSEQPGLALDVAGTVGRAFADPPQGVTFLGLVPYLDGLYRQAGVLISPLTFGSGLKIKLIEGMARGKVVVATPTTLQGVEDVCSPAVLRAEEAEDFADAILKVTGDTQARRALGEAALSVVREHFAADIAHRELRDWLDQA